MLRLLRRSCSALALTGALAFSAASCGPPTSAQLEADAQRDVKAMITTQLGALRQAAVDLQNAAPSGHAWGQADAAQIEQMRAAFFRTRVAYESIEGALAVLFPDTDHAIDARYDDFLSDDGPDADLFDGHGVTGMHAIERILWSDQPHDDVVAYESRLTGYVAARYPQTAQEADEFKTGLCAQLVSDLDDMTRSFQPLTLDSAAAFRGVIGSLQEQVEKITLAASSQDESRYARNTLADMRANLQGGLDTFHLFRTWLVTVQGNEDLATRIEARFAAVKAGYDAIPGAALPLPPAGYNPDMPSAEDAATPYGQLRAMLETESNQDHDGSLVNEMNAAAQAMGIHTLAGM
jgi:iron uptake system component EfeO